MNKKKTLVFAIIGVLLASTLTVAIDFAAAMPPNTGNIATNRLLSASWIRINGIISKLDGSTVRGQLQTQARVAVHQSSDIRQLTAATAIWTTEAASAAEKAKESSDFTYTYYIARLPDVSVSPTSKIESPSTYFLDGTWNVAKVVLTVTTQTNADGTVTKHRTQDISTTQHTGTLTVGTGNTFILHIDGVGDLTGSIYRSITRSWFNPFKMTDDSTTNAVTRSDVKAIAQNYGVMPGWGNFNSNMDFNHNNRVDIADISTVAAHM